VRSLPLPGWQTTLALWGLDIDSELVFVGDAGTTEASRGSRRYGIEWSNYYRVLPWLTLDADLSLSKARFRDGDPAGTFIPGAVEQVAAAGVSVDQMGNVFGSVRVRYFGPRPLTEDGSVRSKASTTVNLLAGYEIVRGLRAQVEIFNLFDTKVSDIDYYYAFAPPRRACRRSRRCSLPPGDASLGADVSGVRLLEAPARRVWDPSSLRSSG
jgi:outer membrane receptor protein involved in Fe transport